MAGEFWLSEAQWQAIEPLLPKNQAGARRVDDRRVLSGIVHVLKVGCRWQDCPAVYGPSTTVYNRFNRWSRQGIWHGMFFVFEVSLNFMHHVCRRVRVERWGKVRNRAHQCDFSLLAQHLLRGIYGLFRQL